MRISLKLKHFCKAKLECLQSVKQLSADFIYQRVFFFEESGPRSLSPPPST